MPRLFASLTDISPDVSMRAIDYLACIRTSYRGVWVDSRLSQDSGQCQSSFSNWSLSTVGHQNFSM